ncbi:MAG: hypothetical protein U1D30_05400 [Planctomycetota bacterium]
MAGILGRAKGMLAGRKSAAPRPFSTRCLCGEVVEGFRQPECQILTCPACRASLIIFPQSPLPEPDVPVKKGRARAREKSDPSLKNAPRAVERPAALPRKPLREIIREKAGRWRAALSGPRTILAVVVVLVLVTGWWQWRARELRRLREQLDPSGRRGLQALANGDLETAWEELSLSVHAMDRLQETFPGGASYRQAYSELAIARDLLDESLEFELTGGTKSPEAVSRKIRDRAFVLDAEVEPGENGAWVVHAAVFMDETPVPFDAHDFRLFGQIGIHRRTRLIFGARLEGVSKDSSGRWSVRWQPDSGVLITEPALLDRLGLSRDPETAGVRDFQRGILSNRSESSTHTSE